MQIIIILETFKDFFAGKFVLGANHHYPLSWKYSKNFSPAKFSQTQIIIILKIFKDFFAFKDVLDAYHHYPLSWKYSKTFSPAKVSLPQMIIILEILKDFFDCKIVLAANHHYLENIQRLFCLQKCLRRKSSLSWKYSKTFSPAKLSSTQITIILKIFKDFFACNIVLDANHHYPGNIQRFFRWQICLRRKSSLSIILKIFKEFFASKILSDANHHYPENIQRLFRL